MRTYTERDRLRQNEPTVRGRRIRYLDGILQYVIDSKVIADTELPRLSQYWTSVRGSRITRVTFGYAMVITYVVPMQLEEDTGL